MRDLAPEIYRQRLMIEGLPEKSVKESDISQYLTTLAEKLEMNALNEPVTHLSEKFGWSAWMHWETSGVHFYAWDSPAFFSVDIYTCKPFEVKTAVDFTKAFFKTKEIEYKEF